MLAPIVLTGGLRYPSSGWRSGAVLLVIAAGIGITVLRLIDRLRSSEERHRLLAENSSDLVTRFSLDGTILYASPSSFALLGYRPDQLVGRNVSDLLHPDDRVAQRERREFVDATNGDDTFTVEFRLRHREGHWRWFEATTRAIRDASGAVIERQVASRPIDERKRLQSLVEREREAASDLLADQTALRTIATLVAAGAQPQAVFESVAEQVAHLFDAALGSVVRFDFSAGVGQIIGSWSSDDTTLTGRTIDLSATTAAAMVSRTGNPVRIGGYGGGRSDPIVDGFALGGGIAAPIRAVGKLWGSVSVAFSTHATIPDGAGERLVAYGELVAVAIAAAEALETLSRQASTDPVTGLPNYRAFHERLNAEIGRSSRYGRALCVAVLDIDHFKRVNDSHGHQAGDQVLAEVGRRLAAAVRTGELIARIGGEEFAWLLPETDAAAAYKAAERVRCAILGTSFDVAGTLTISIGVCSSEYARTAQDLVGFADQALYTSKRRGRNVTSVYSEHTPSTLAAISHARPPAHTAAA
jgi:diguanylate cyclase (GGDEF)-like protein/PAS domain S-box-containing protein